VVVGTVSSNMPLTVVARDRNWLKILIPGTAGQEGWVHMDALQSEAGDVKVGPASAAIAPAALSSAITAQPPAPQVTTKTSSTVAPSTTKPSAATVATSAASIPAGGPVVRIWLASLKSRELAERDWRDLQAAYGDLLADLEPTVRQVDLGSEKGGIWYRIYAGPLASRDNAQALCAEIKSRSPRSNCLVVVE
jgi:cell division septation protein DedD